jgi:hypothetical protein
MIIILQDQLYFGSIQLLRVFSDWIEESREDFENLSKYSVIYLNDPVDVDGEKVEIDKKSLISAMEKSAEEQKIRFQALLDQIKKKQNEIESLRDGVSIPNHSI